MINGQWQAAWGQVPELLLARGHLVPRPITRPTQLPGKTQCLLQKLTIGLTEMGLHLPQAQGQARHRKLT